ncbi:phosphoesterase family-domain-containing protein [Mucor mucedo]|uniref:phosphoesterase family-domain-containing protein n=1 Tax=Mucor mucedo TaxID=29922 RepID=UPI00221F3AFD|nr:phosphoesterase family-domain-containing protein [Mucor mucedo]KAI7889145.1 phosphoesterase family-domain-containing protein [Mucor mucedo]
MHISFASILTVAALVGLASAKKHDDHGHKEHKPKVPKGKAFDHILQIWFENTNFNDANSTPGFSKLLKKGILLDNFNAVTHPSEPNYVAAGGGSNFGIDDDDYYNIPAHVPSIFDLIENKGLTWKCYQEDIPSVGYTGDKAGDYVRKHNPAVSFDAVGLNATRLKNIVGHDQFVKDIHNDKLPNWMFYTPNMKNDAHDTNISYAGNWLDNFYKKTLDHPNLLKKTLVMITFDENASFPQRNRVWTLLFGDIPKKLRGTIDHTFYTHFSTLSTVEHNWDLGNLGQQDVNKTVSNVFKHTAKALKYKNIHIADKDVPWSNNTITGLMTGKSYNDTQKAI